MSTSLACAASSQERQPGASIPLDLVLIAFVATAGLTMSWAMLVFTDFDWLAAMQLGAF